MYSSPALHLRSKNISTQGNPLERTETHVRIGGLDLHTKPDTSSDDCWKSGGCVGKEREWARWRYRSKATAGDASKGSSERHKTHGCLVLRSLYGARVCPVEKLQHVDTMHMVELLHLQVINNALVNHPGS